MVIQQKDGKCEEGGPVSNIITLDDFRAKKTTDTDGSAILRNSVSAPEVLRNVPDFQVVLFCLKDADGAPRMALRLRGDATAKEFMDIPGAALFSVQALVSAVEQYLLDLTLNE